METKKSSVRIQLQDWLNPMPVPSLFTREQPLEIDVGCGKGRFLLARAARAPDVNLLGIDRLLGRLRKIDRRVQRAGLENVRLLRMDAYYATRYLLPPDSVTTYYVFFPDPWPKARHHKHRLFDTGYVDALFNTLKQGGAVHVATDHAPYFEEIQAVLDRDTRFEAIEPYVPPEDERTDFELLYLDTKPIGRCSFVKR